MEASWPDGPAGLMRFAGIGRDLRTDATGAGTVIDQVELHVDIDPAERRVVGLRVTNANTASGIRGARLGRELREAIEVGLPAEIERGAVVIQLFDDLVGAWIVSGVALETWGVSTPGPPLRTARGDRKQMVGICRGFAPGSSGLAADGGYAQRVHAPTVAPLGPINDPLAWHDAPYGREMSVRRVRRIDVRTGSEVEIDSMFQDSSTTPSGGRVGIHEYSVMARAKATSWELTAISATPRILPYDECPFAAAGVAALIGTRLPELRDRVLTDLAGVHGCTHLNDAVRALSGAGQLAGSVRRCD
jgi:hypothetical protein